MRITNTDYTPVEVLAELLATRGITDQETNTFFSGTQESHDWLVTAWRDKLEVILESFKRYGTEAAETQFIRDHGVDVRMTYEDSFGDTQRIGFQIKSNKEAIFRDGRWVYSHRALYVPRSARP